MDVITSSPSHDDVIVHVAVKRLMAISDLHVDHPENKRFLSHWCSRDYLYHEDGLLLAGDISDSLALVEQTLTLLARTFKKVFFVPGNHDLWMQKQDKFSDSLAKLRGIVEICRRLGVVTQAARVTLSPTGESVWVVPLFSWYSTPEDDAENTLCSNADASDEEVLENRRRWTDTYLCQWPPLDVPLARYFADMNEGAVSRVRAESGAEPVITMSHFIPRAELTDGSEFEESAIGRERARLGLAHVQLCPPDEGLDFTRFAGSKIIDRQIRQLGSVLHVHGHQHRNRDRVIDRVRYISHCLGFPRERARGMLWGNVQRGPRQVWPQPP